MSMSTASFAISDATTSPVFGAIVMPEGIGRLEDFPNLTAAMERRRWTETRIRRVLGENWLRFLDDAWAAPDRPK